MEESDDKSLAFRFTPFAFQRLNVKVKNYLNKIYSNKMLDTFIILIRPSYILKVFGEQQKYT